MKMRAKALRKLIFGIVLGNRENPNRIHPKSKAPPSVGRGLYGLEYLWIDFFLLKSINQHWNQSEYTHNPNIDDEDNWDIPLWVEKNFEVLEAQTDHPNQNQYCKNICSHDHLHKVSPTQSIWLRSWRA